MKFWGPAMTVRTKSCGAARNVISRLARISFLPGSFDSASTPALSRALPSKKPPMILNLGSSLAHLRATLAGVWGFNGYYVTGLNIVYLPWEELLFFVTVPFASIFIYECLNAYFPGDPLARWDKPITLGLIIGCFILGLLYISKAYSSTTFILTGGFMLYHWYYVPNTYRTRFYRAFLVILIPFLLVDGVLTGGFTKEPIVLYNPEEYMGIRILSVPFEDAVYGFLLLFGVCYWLEWLRKNH